MTEIEMIRLFVKSNWNYELQMVTYEHVLYAVGYRLPLPIEKKVSDKERLEKLRRIKSDWKINDKRRKVRRIETERVTRCKSVRSSSGSYLYIDIESGCEVSPETYKSRYAEYILSLKASNHTNGSSFLSSNSSLKRYLVDEVSKSICTTSNPFDILVAAAASISSIIIPTETSNHKRSSATAFLNDIDINNDINEENDRFYDLTPMTRMDLRLNMKNHKRVRLHE
mmetsp:Transcript_19695/g.19795  ORF Transcript_19695/g.19795 Transcript_19695/m.19795 type:complete len:226 (-) Transcript_19695:23-700(-)